MPWRPRCRRSMRPAPGRQRGPRIRAATTSRADPSLGWADIARGRAKICPLNRAVRNPETGGGEALDVDELARAALVLRATSTAVRIGAHVEHHRDNRARAGLQANVVALQCGEIRKDGNDVVRLDPAERHDWTARREHALVQASAVLDALLAAGIRVRGVLGFVRRLPHQSRRRTTAGRRRRARPYIRGRGAARTLGAASAGHAATTGRPTVAGCAATAD